jgi:hypothetical protein
MPWTDRWPGGPLRLWHLLGGDAAPRGYERCGKRSFSPCVLFWQTIICHDRLRTNIRDNQTKGAFSAGVSAFGFWGTTGNDTKWTDKRLSNVLTELDGTVGAVREENAVFCAPFSYKKQKAFAKTRGQLAGKTNRIAFRRRIVRLLTWRSSIGWRRMR